MTLLVACGGKKRAPVLEREEEPDLTVDCATIPLDRLPETSSAFEETSCDAGVEDRITQRGTVTVPVAPGSDETITIAVARVFSVSDSPREDPIVYLDGGPGGPSLGGLDVLHPIMEEMSPDRDFVFLDQRGVGLSRPNLQCTETQEDIFEAIDACHERLSDEIDLNEVNTINNAHDIDQIRQALGYDQWNLLGVSYGTRLGLTVMRDYPEGVRSALIDSVVPLHRDILGELGANGYSAIVYALDQCAADDDCSDAYPDPMGQLEALVEELNENPGGDDAWITGDFFVRFVFEFLYSPFGVAAVPRIIDDAAQGDFEIFENLASGGTSGSGLSFGMHLSLHCSEEVPFSSREEYEAFDESVPEAFRPALSGRDYLDWCEHWPVEPAAASENEPVVSDVPTLVLAGEFDPITPPDFAEAAHEHLTNSTYVLVLNESHGASFSECGRELAEQFFDAPEEPVGTSCVNRVPDLEWASVSPIRTGTVARMPDIDFHVGPLSGEDVERLRQELQLRVR